jgi:2-dehydro-3-deoxyphosphogluconate aldolase/(4S)-4-hydroxy-2-oxoglutarate aldolase
MNDVLKQIARVRLVPMIVLDKVEYAGPLADALVAGGLPVAEVTFRAAAAEESIRAMAQRGDLLVGAGTVLTVDQADRAIDAGARFIVSPGTNPKVVDYCLERSVTVAPGVATPTDIELAMSLGVTTLKFFPAETMGGVKALKALSGPYREVRFIPTGGINQENLPRYLELPCVVACGGSWLAPRNLLAEGRFDAIRRLAQQAVELLAGPPKRAT